MSDPIGFTEEEQEEMERMLKEKFEKALKEDPFYNPKLRKKAAKESKPKKKFGGYNWTTQKKMAKGRRDTIKELKAKKKLTDKKKILLKRLQNLQKWYNWALKHHKEGKSDKWIHEETKRRKEARASK